MLNIFHSRLNTATKPSQNWGVQYTPYMKALWIPPILFTAHFSGGTLAMFIIISKSRNTFQYPLSKRVCKRLSKRVSRVVAFIIELYREYESRGRPCHCAAALRSLTRGAEIM